MRPSISDLLGLDSAPTPSLVDAATVADFLGVTPRHVNRMATDGLIPREGPNLFDLRTAVRAFITHRLAEKPGTADRARRDRANADLMEAKAASVRAELVPVAEVERRWSAVTRDVRAAMLAVPARVRSRVPDLTPAAIALIDAEVRAALASMSGGEDDHDA